MVISYNKLIACIKASIKCLSKLEINEEVYNKYYECIYRLKKDIYKITDKRLSLNRFNISRKDIKIKYDNIILNLYSFLNIYYIQRYKDNNRLLFFKTDPEKCEYQDNVMIFYEDIVENDYIHPVWYFMIDNKVTDDYTKIMKDYNLNYEDLMDIRVIVKEEYNDECKIAVESRDKYKCSYESKNISLILKDPFNINQDISYKRQGVKDGLYCFIDAIDPYSLSECIVAINNTIAVLDRLVLSLNNMVEEIKLVRKEINDNYY
jgi:hypothetical protein